MKKTIALLLIIVTITGCQFMPVKKEQIAVPDIHTGVNGVTLEFLENAPPAEIYEERPFDIIVKVHNQGANDIRGGMLLIGVEEQNVELAGQKDTRFDLAGKSAYNPEGVFDMKQFRATARKLGPAAGKIYPTTVTATACYAYKTAATALVCIDTDLLGIVKNKPCKTSTQSHGSGQGAPVAVTSVVPKMLPHADPDMITPEFTISIANRGVGDVVAGEKIYEACSGKKLGQESWNAVKISASLSDQYLECKPSVLKIVTGENKAVCTITGGISKELGTYLAPLSIELDYGYMSRKVKSMSIIRLLGSSY